MLISVSEEQLIKIIHDVVKVIRDLQDIAIDCKHCEKYKVFKKYEKLLMNIREEILGSIVDMEKKEDKNV